MRNTRNRTSKLWCRLGLMTLVLCALAGTVNAQHEDATNERWVWKQVARKNKPQTQFTLVINRDGDVIRGTYSVDTFINGKWQGEDGNQTPFAGRIVAGRLELEFDPDATVPGYEENVTYKPPTDGRKPARAVLTEQGRTLSWRITDGRIEGVPARITLRRESRPQP